MPGQQKITFGEMRASGASQVIVHCGDFKCGHSVTMYPALWPDNVRLSDLEERFVCTVCGHRATADVRPLFEGRPKGGPARGGVPLWGTRRALTTPRKPKRGAASDKT
jgi:hypothetical protein